MIWFVSLNASSHLCFLFLVCFDSRNRKKANVRQQRWNTSLACDVNRGHVHTEARCSGSACTVCSRGCVLLLLLLLRLPRRLLLLPLNTWLQPFKDYVWCLRCEHVGVASGINEDSSVPATNTHVDPSLDWIFFKLIISQTKIRLSIAGLSSSVDIHGTVWKKQKQKTKLQQMT